MGMIQDKYKQLFCFSFFFVILILNHYLVSSAICTEISHYNTQGKAVSIYKNDNYIYIADCANGVIILNVENPNQPTKINNITFDDCVWNVFVMNNIMYVSANHSGIYIYNVSDPNFPTIINHINTTGPVQNVFVENNILFSAEWNFGISIYNISNLENQNIPKIITFNTSGYANWVEVKDNIAYLADWNYGLRVINFTLPSSPVEIAEYDTSGTAVRVRLKRNVLYMADDNKGVQAINITNPRFPTLIYNYNTIFGRTNAVDTNENGNLIFIADVEGDLVIVDVSDLDYLDEIETIYTNGNVYDVLIDGNIAYICDGEFGLRIYDISDYNKQIQDPNGVGNNDIWDFDNLIEVFKWIGIIFIIILGVVVIIGGIYYVSDSISPDKLKKIVLTPLRTPVFLISKIKERRKARRIKKEQDQQSNINLRYKISKILLNLAEKYPRVTIDEVAEKANLNKSLTKKIVKKIIDEKQISASYDEKQISASYDENSDGIEFRLAIDELDRLIRQYDDWENNKSDKI